MASIVSAGTTSATALNMSADTSGVLQLASNNGTVALTVDTSQNVGIGTSSPSTYGKFGVVSGANFFGVAAGVFNSATFGPRPNNDGFCSLTYYWSTLASGNFWVNDYTSSNVDWQRYSGGSASGVLMRLDSSGRVGVGTTSPNGRFTVASNGGDPNTNLNNFAITTFGAYGGGIFMLDSADPNSGTGYAIWTDDNGNDFNIARGSTSSSASGGVFINNSAGSWSSRSDERDKINLMPIEGALGKVSQLRAVTGEYIWAEGARHPFLIAQDVQAVLPEAVCVANKSATPEDQRLGVSYTDIIPLLVAAIKELNAKVTALENK